MAFPLTHLIVAKKILELRPMTEEDGAQFLLGAISPDAVHYREEFMGDGKSSIGPTKKISHICPVSEERWGQVTDNEGWIQCVKEFLRENSSPFAQGYAAHVLTDIYNNQTIWNTFRTEHPAEAAKGYGSGYYTDLHHIDTRLYNEYPGVSEIFALLAKAVPCDMPGRVFARETAAIQQNLLHEHFKNAKNAPIVKNYTFVTWDDTVNFTQSAAKFCTRILPLQANLC